MTEFAYDDDPMYAGQTDSDQVWAQPQPFRTVTGLPPFPADALPDWVRDQVLAVSEFTQTPVDLPAMVALAVLATAAGGRVVVEVRGSWREPTNLYCVCSLPPGSRKSSVFAEMTRPLQDVEEELARESFPKILEAETLRTIAEADAKAAMLAAAKGEDQKGLSANAISKAQLAEAITVPTKPRLIADDITPEAAASLLAQQGGRLSVLSAEGGIFQILAGRYSTVGASLEVFLKGHSGDMLRVDRKGRDSEHVRHPALTLGLVVQPEIIRAIASMPGFRGRGLLARILYSLPENTVGHRQVGVPSPPPHIGLDYAERITTLVQVLHEWVDPMVLRLSPEAAALLIEAERAIEPKLAPHGELGMIVDWACKLIGAIARVSGLHHVAVHGEASYTQPISEQSVAAALRIGEYLTAHARAAFEQMGADPVVEDARYILDWITRTRAEKFTRRDAHRGCRRFQKVGDLDPALGVLEEHEYIIRRPDSPRPRGGRASPVYDVNPWMHTYVPDVTFVTDGLGTPSTPSSHTYGADVTDVTLGPGTPSSVTAVTSVTSSSEHSASTCVVCGTAVPPGQAFCSRLCRPVPAINSTKRRTMTRPRRHLAITPGLAAWGTRRGAVVAAISSTSTAGAASRGVWNRSVPARRWYRRRSHERRVQVSLHELHETDSQEPPAHDLDRSTLPGLLTWRDQPQSVARWFPRGKRT